MTLRALLQTLALAVIAAAVVVALECAGWWLVVDVWRRL